MLRDLLNQEVDNRLSWASKIDEIYGVKINALSVDELFELYRRTGFLYPAKAAPFSLIWNWCGKIGAACFAQAIHSSIS